ncbi:MAG: endolytic transglycosylase MltG, partial [Wenzhouxiangella sp.]
NLPLESPDELRTLASIVERETGVAGERARVAGVFVRRLERGMRLQTDPTVIYGLDDDFEGRLRRVHLQTDHPWNTYTRHGLPPTPIALPGREALEAAANPAPGTALYFVSRGDGTHQFSDSLLEHNRAVDCFIRGNH